MSIINSLLLNFHYNLLYILAIADIPYNLHYKPSDHITAHSGNYVETVLQAYFQCKCSV